jgi:hypothetical protein
VGLGEVARLADSEPCSPEDDDQRPQAGAVTPVAGGTHDGDDLLDRRRVGRKAESFVFRRATPVKAGHRRRRAAMTGGIQQLLLY